jgi:hypothetical protein
VVEGLWDCWEDGALVADKARGLYIDDSKIRPLDHKGRFFRVKRPMSISADRRGTRSSCRNSSAAASLPRIRGPDVARPPRLAPGGRSAAAPSRRGRIMTTEISTLPHAKYLQSGLTSSFVDSLRLAPRNLWQKVC